MAYRFAIFAGGVRWNGAVVRLEIGQAWAADDPFVTARPELFTDEPAMVHRTVPAPERPARRTRRAKAAD
ncbi:hypothetical protein ACQP2K_30660 [Microbispora siamensis]